MSQFVVQADNEDSIYADEHEDDDEKHRRRVAWSPGEIQWIFDWVVKQRAREGDK